MKPSSKSSHKSSLEGSEGKLPSSKAGKVSSSKSPVSTTNLAWVLGKFYNLGMAAIFSFDIAISNIIN